MALTTVEYNYAGQASFPLPFPLGIISREHVTVQVNGAVDGSGDPLNYTDLTWVSDAELSVNNLTVGDTVLISRTVPKLELVTSFEDGADVTHKNLDAQARQLLMLSHEIIDNRYELDPDTAVQLSQLFGLVNTNTAGITALGVTVNALASVVPVYLDTITELRAAVANRALVSGVTYSSDGTTGHDAADDDGLFVIVSTAGKKYLRDIARPLYRDDIPVAAGLDVSGYLQSYFNLPGYVVKVLSGGEFNVSSGVTSSLDFLTVNMAADATIKALAGLVETTPMFDVTNAQGTVLRLNIDGDNIGAVAVKYTNCLGLTAYINASNLYAPTLTARGIFMTDCDGFNIEGGTFTNIWVPPFVDGIFGNGFGLARAVVAYFTRPTTQPNYLGPVYIDGVYGEEGDAISILGDKQVGDLYFADVDLTIYRPVVKNASRRFIKIQGSNVTVIGPSCSFDPALYSTAAYPSGLNRSTVVDSIHSNNVTILCENNEIIAPVGMVVFRATSPTATDRVTYNLSNVRAKGSDPVLAALFFDGLDSDSTIKDVAVSGGGAGALGIQNCLGTNLLDLSFYGDDIQGVCVSTATNNTGLVFDNVRDYTTARDYTFNHRAPDCQIMNVVKLTDSAGCIRTYLSASGTIWMNITNNRAFATIADGSDDTSDQTYINIVNASGGATGV